MALHQIVLGHLVRDPRYAEISSIGIPSPAADRIARRKTIVKPVPAGIRDWRIQPLTNLCLIRDFRRRPSLAIRGPQIRGEHQPFGPPNGFRGGIAGRLKRRTRAWLEGRGGLPG